MGETHTRNTIKDIEYFAENASNPLGVLVGANTRVQRLLCLGTFCYDAGYESWYGVAFLTHTLNALSYCIPLLS